MKLIGLIALTLLTTTTVWGNPDYLLDELERDLFPTKELELCPPDYQLFTYSDSEGRLFSVRCTKKNHKDIRYEVRSE